MVGAGARRRALRGGIALTLAFAGLLAGAGPSTAQTAAPSIGEGFQLEQNFPNPFTPGISPTIFTYRLDLEAHVRLTIYNLLGQEIAVLVDRIEEEGLHRVAWDGSDKDGELVPAGVYFYKLQAGDRSALRRLRVRDPSEPTSGTDGRGAIVLGSAEPRREIG